ncbi:MAG: hypothetical protein D6796_02300 [Caldilineae bacterium]|nr:MAG: hypothetical protein D6796_02300 [Caldilineae bacterium]
MQDALAQLDDALHWLNRSYRQCRAIGVKRNYQDEELDLFEALTSRFARVSDILLQKVYRSIDAVEFETGGTMIDVVNRAEKRGLIDSVDEIRTIRDLRNSIAHEYIGENLIPLFQDTLQYTPTLLKLVARVKTYCQRYTPE